MSKRPKRRFPAWHIPLLQQCAVFAEVKSFPDNELRDRFSTTDANNRLPPAQELAEFVLTHFVDGGAASGNVPLIQGAEKMLREAIKHHGSILSAWDLARLHAAHGVLLRAMAFDSHERLEYARRAIAAFRRAIGILRSEQLSTRLCRHLAWLTADAIFNLAGGRAEPGLQVEMLIFATQGDPSSSTKGLYFGCISRSFLLSETDFQTFSRAVRDDLYRAWTALPAARDVPSKKEPPATQHKSPLGLHPDFAQLSALFVPDENAPLMETAEIGESLSSDLVWEPEDRLAVCAFLARADAGLPSALAYTYEAHALRHKISERKEEGRRAAAILAYVDSLPAAKRRSSN